MKTLICYIFLHISPISETKSQNRVLDVEATIHFSRGNRTPASIRKWEASRARVLIGPGLVQSAYPSKWAIDRWHAYTAAVCAAYIHGQICPSVYTHARIIHSVTISRKSIIKPLSCSGYNGRGELFWSGCIVLAGSPVGLELSARHAHGRYTRPHMCAPNARLFARMTRIIEMDVDWFAAGFRSRGLPIGSLLLTLK